MSARSELWVCHLGVVDYGEALALQERVRELRQADALPDVLLLLEHPAVYTRGRRSDPDELPLGERWYRDQGIEIVDVDRGGKLTYHGPGQLVGYPIMRAPDVVAFVRTMERAIIAALADSGVSAATRTGLTGVWVDERKIASIGIHVSRRVTTHGFAINVDNDLAPFEWVVPCGLTDVRMTSVASELAGKSALACESALTRCVRRRVAWRFAEAHDLRQRLVTPARLIRELGVPQPA